MRFSSTSVDFRTGPPMLNERGAGVGRRGRPRAASQGESPMTHPNRRQFLRTAAGTAALATLPSWAAAEQPTGFSLPKLPYAYDALEPHIDMLTMQIHHDRHHQAYVTNLNAALKDSP